MLLLICWCKNVDKIFSAFLIQRKYLKKCSGSNIRANQFQVRKSLPTIYKNKTNKKTKEKTKKTE